MARPLLPEIRLGTPDKRANWSAGNTATGVFAITPQLAKENLIWPQGLVASAVSHPLAAAKGFAWRLGRGNDDPEAAALLRFMLQLQFLGCVEHARVDLNGGGLMKTVLQVASARPAMYIWRVRGLTLEVPILGASFDVDAEFPVFPSAALQEMPERFIQCLEGVASARPDVRLDGQTLVFTGPERDLRFRQAVGRLAADVTSGPWKSALNHMAAGAEAAPRPARLPGLIRPDIEGGNWECPSHAASGLSWVDDCSGRTVTVSAVQPKLVCPVHEHTVLRNEQNQEVTAEHLGAAVLQTANGTELIVWSDVARPPQTMGVTIEVNALSFSYWHAGGPRIRLEGRVVNFDQVRSASYPLPSQNENDPSHTLALKPPFLGLVEGTPRWKSGSSEWSVRIKGRGPEERLPTPTRSVAEPRDGVVIWPSEIPANESDSSGPRWAGDVLAAYFAFVDEAAPVTRRKAAGREYLHVESFRRLPFVAASEPDHGTIEYMALRKDNVDLGVVPFRRSARRFARELVGHVAIDFGTSNTVVAYRLQDDATVRFVEQGVSDPRQHCHFAAAGNAFGNTLDELLMVYSAWFRQEESARMFGSLLLARSGGERGYSILPRQPRLLGRISGEDMQLHHDLKWSRPTHSIRILLSRFIERSLARPFYDLMQQGCGTIHVAATYPLAFDEERKGRLQQALEDAVNRLTRATGVTAPTPRLFNESAAGVAVTGGEIAEYTLTIDLGGGTTDLAIVSDRGRVAHAVDSLEIGGRGLLSAVIGRANDDERQRIEANLRLGSMNVPRDVALESVLQTDPRDVAIGMTPATNQIRVRQSVAAMLAAIVVAAVRLARAVVPNRNVAVNVVLLGQGWELLRRQVLGPFDERWFLDALDAHADPYLRLRRTTTQVQGADRKLALAMGALRLLKAALDHQQTAAPMKLGMELRCANGRICRPEDTIWDLTGIEPATGDPGFGPVIDELVSVMTSMSARGPQLADISAELSRTGASGLPARQELVHSAIQRLLDGMAEGQLRSSPLMRFLDGPWKQFWAGSPSGAAAL